MKSGPLLVLLALVARAAPAQVEDSATFQRIDAYVARMIRSARFPGVAVGIVSGDRVVHLRGFGRADPSGQPVTPQTPFLIGSVTK